MFEKIQKIFNCKIHTFTHGVDVHVDRIQWLQENANIYDFFDFECDDSPTKEFPNGKYQFRAIVTDRILENYKKKDSLWCFLTVT